MLDAADKCPDKLEDKDGFEDADGCPDPDNDGDGVLDTADKCPNTPKGVKVDATGCPVAEMKTEVGGVLILEGVNFATGSAELTPTSSVTLDKVAESLNAWPDVTIEVGGHTDSSGNDAANKKLSQARADAVRQYLIGKGVAGTRITAVGYGEEKPIADNATKDGKATEPSRGTHAQELVSPLIGAPTRGRRRRPRVDSPAAVVYLPPMPTTTPVSQRELARFWWPLMATWLMMAAEGPFIAAVIARLPDPKPNLAAYGVAFAFAIILEAPVIMMLSAATALVTDRPRYVALRRFATGLNVAVTASMVVMLATPLGAWLLGDVLRLGPQVAELTWTSLLLLLPWPAAIGYRRFYQGVLIRGGRPRLVAVGTIARLAAMAATGIALAKGTDWPGAWVGAGALSMGVCAEAVAVRVMVGPVLARLAPGAGDAPLTQRAILEFYAPLALTSAITLAVQPLVTFFMGQARSPLESLAVLPVVHSFVFVFRTFGLSLQEVAIARLDESPANLAPVRRFAFVLAAIASAGLALIAFTPAARVWFEGVSGLSPDLAAFALPPTRILALMPALSVLLAWQWAVLVWGRRTRSITAASLVEVAVIAIMLVVLVLGAGMVGATAAAAAFLIGRIAGTTALLAPCRGVIRSGSGLERFEHHAAGRRRRL